MNELMTHHLLFVTEVVTPLALDEHSGSAIRGNLFEAVWRRFCNNRAAATCAECPLHTLCPVSALVAPLREDHPRGRDIPRPYIIIPPMEGARYYAPGEQFTFGVTLFGRIIELLPYLMLSLSVLENVGLGKRLPERGGERGRFKVKRVDSYHPFTGERRTIYRAEKARVDTSVLTVTAMDVQTKAATLHKDTLTLHFLTPTFIKDQTQSPRSIEFGPLIHRLLERFSALRVAYGDGQDQTSEERVPIVDLARHVQRVVDETRWEAVIGYSHRTRQHTAIGGVRGRVTFAGNIEPFAELLVWGEVIHVGKNCVKGNGWYRIEATG